MPRMVMALSSWSGRMAIRRDVASIAQHGEAVTAVLEGDAALGIDADDRGGRRRERSSYRLHLMLGVLADRTLDAL
jgi:hypothetical protein